MTSRPTFNLRLRAYTPLGDPGKIIPDLGITLVSSPDGPTLTATVTTVVYGSLPDDLEVAVEVWADSIGAWQEGRDSRFVILGQQHDDRDVTGVVTITGIGLMQWLAQKAALAGVTPYQDSGNVEAAATGTGISVSGSTFTWASHILGEGDRVRITDSGKSKGLSKGSVYFVRNPSGSTFQVSHTVNGAITSFGSSHTIKMERVRTRIVNLNAHKFSKNQAISVWDATAKQALTNGSQYYVVNPTASTIQVATKPGGIPVELVADALIVYRYLDGARQFKNQTPGQIIGDSFLEARDRGWGQDASGNDQVFHSWTNAGDSNSLAWPARVDDPTITGVSVGFQPGTPLWDQIRFMLDNGWAEFASHGRTLDLFAPNTGTDYGATANQRRIGTVAQQLPVTKDLTDYRTAETVRGDGPVENTVTNARSPWGRLEVYTTASGVGSAKHAKSYAQGDLTANSKPAIGYQVTEAAQEAAYLPILDFQRGDWVMVQVKGAWTRLRVTQWTLQKNTDGTATSTVLLEKKKRTILHKVAGASRRANGGRAATTTSNTPHESDKRKAAKPSNLSVTARTVHAADKSTKSTITAAWAPVTTDEDGDDLTGAGYEVHVRTEGEQAGKPVASTKGTSADLAGYAAGQKIAVSVRAQSSTGEWGELTGEVEYVVDGPEDLLDAPSAPTVTSTLGSVVIAWDGNLVDLIDGPQPAAGGFAFVQVQRSADNGATWTAETQTLPAPGTVTDLGLTVGSTYSYRLIAVDVLGRASAPSVVVSCVVVGVDVAQINANFKASMDQVAAISQNAQTVANQSAATAGLANTTASNALTSANGKNTITYAAAAPSGSGTTAGDLWFQVDSSNRLTGQWSWVVTNGTGAWVANTLAGSVLAAGAVDTAQLSTAVQNTISNATSAASSAQSTAVAAQTSANGKTTVHYSTAVASGNGATSGDIWWQVSGTGSIVAWWVWNGSTWVAQALATTMIPNLDAGKITTGTLAAGLIGANTITASQIAIADFTNVVAGSDFEVPGNIPWPTNSTWTVSTSQAHSGTTSFHAVGVAGANTTPGVSILPTQPQSVPGDLWYAEFWAYADSSWNGTVNNSKLRFGNQTGSLILNLDFGAASLTAGQWVKRSVTLTTPANATALSISLFSDATAGNVWIDDIIVRRKSAGSLIVDGTITASQIAANTITAAKIVAGTITSNEIAAGTIQASDIAAGTITSASGVIGALDAGAITTGTLNAARIAARSISVSQVAVADFTNLFPSPHFDSVGGGSLFNSSAYTAVAAPVGSAILLNARDNVSTYTFPVKAGDSFYIEATVKPLTGTAPLTPTLWVTKNDGSSGASDSPAWQSYGLFGLTTFVGTVFSTNAAGWARYGYKVTIPSTWTGVAYAQAYFQINESDTSTSWAASDLLIRRAANAALIVDGSISASSIAAGAIDGKTITGATIQTASTAKTSGGVILDSTGITGYNAAGSATFRVDNAGNTTMTGTVNATGGSITGTLAVTGTINVTSGSIKASSGTATAFLGNGYLAVNDTSSGNSVLTGNALSVSGGTVVLQNDGAGSGILTTQYNSLRLLGHSSGGGGDLTLDNDGSARVASMAIYNRSVSTRAVYVASTGVLGTTSSSRRTKNLHRHLKMDDAVLEKWLELPTWEFEYKPEVAPDSPGVQHGLVAEEVEAAGFTTLVYYDDREGDTHGQVDGFAYERMGVYNHMALKRLYSRLQAAEQAVEKLTRKASQ